MTDAHVGTCFCGAVAIEVRGAPVEIGYCHCSSCRAYSGAPIKAYALWKSGNVRVTRGAELLGRFNKAGFSERHHCTRCGGHLLVVHPGLGVTDVCAAILPTLPFRPSVHLNYAETVFPMRDGPPKLRDFPAEAGGSGEIVAE